MDLIDGPIQHYDWGSLTAIPDLLGRPVTEVPAAELWLGAHPRAPALVGSDHRPLDQIVSADPLGSLGAEVDGRFGALPFLLKVLAADAPLSLQVHPSIAQAEAGYAREDAAGIALDAPNRSFRDRNHKPELICALTVFDALCGFREPAATLDLLTTIETPGLDIVRAMLRADPSAAGLRSLLEWLLTLDEAEAAALAGQVAAACLENRSGPYAPERAMASALGARYPGDAGVITALLLNLVSLQPGEALFLGEGNLHAYLHGMGVEIMASSDNVLRGGLTSKHVDVAALIEIVDTEPVVPRIQHLDPVGGFTRYEAPVPDFSLDRIEFDGELTLEPGPAILLCTAGVAHVGGHTLDQGCAAWVPAVDGAVTLDGSATIFRAGVGELR